MEEMSLQWEVMLIAFWGWIVAEVEGIPYGWAGLF